LNPPFITFIAMIMAAKLEISIFALWAVSTSFINQLSRRLTGAIRFGTDCKSAPAGVFAWFGKQIGIAVVRNPPMAPKTLKQF
jgi:hypothetical protein